MLPELSSENSASSIPLDLSSGPNSQGYNVLDAAWADLTHQLQELALAPDGYGRVVFVFDTANSSTAQAILSDWGNGVFLNLPDVVVLSDATLNGNAGAYSAQRQEIYLSSTLVQSDDLTGALPRVLAEELGHYIDHLLNPSGDTVGDEGELFSKVLLGQEVTDAELARIQSENDFGLLHLGGENVAVEFSSASSDSAGNSLESARNVGTLSGSQSFSDFVGSADSNDYYRFDITNTSTFSLSLTGLSADADVHLLDSSGGTIASSARGGSSSESISHELSVGTYYARVYQYSGDTNYNLSLTADSAGNSLGSARNIGTLNGTRSFSDFVGSADSNDYYRFDINNTTNFSLSLTGLSADADVHLLNSSGGILASSARGGSDSESISHELGAGTYYARVYQYSGDTNYNLSLTADNAGNSLGSARNIGTLSGTRSFSDFVGSTDSNDYYRFNINDPTNFSLSLTGLSADADVHLLNSSGETIDSSAYGGSSSESISHQLSAGTYYARVYQYSGDTTYNLSLTADSANQNLLGVSLSSQIRPGSDNVNLWLYDTGGRNTTGYIDPNRDTVVVIHGWQSSDDSREISRLAREAAESGQQVLALDWSSIAGSDELDSSLDLGFGEVSAFAPIETAQWITPVARWASATLDSLGIARNQLTLIGHSLGAYVASEIGRIGGDVANLVALDPAYPSHYDLDINTGGIQTSFDFRDVAEYSLSWVVGDNSWGIAGDNNKAATAHDSFIIDNWENNSWPWSPLGSGYTDAQAEAHSAVVDLFRDALDHGFVNLNGLEASRPSLVRDQYDDNGNNGIISGHQEHEGVIDARWNGHDWQIDGLRRVVGTSSSWLGLFESADEETTWT
jgi:pimeloyl-ACP methyl ester carboxylesterase